MYTHIHVLPSSKADIFSVGVEHVKEFMHKGDFPIVFCYIMVYYCGMRIIRTI